jgi:succinyl-diaminopimelate desuccinylase
MIQDLIELASIPSIKTDSTGNSPYGRFIQQALDWFLAKSSAYGLTAENLDNQAGLAWLGNPSETYIGIFAHLDVVKADGIWTHPPFEPAVTGSRIYGRGVLDNKGPLIACLHALKELKAEGFEPAAPICLVAGTDEESGMHDMDWYTMKKPAPSAGFTPDCKFPAVYAERGRILVQHPRPNSLDIVRETEEGTWLAIPLELSVQEAVQQAGGTLLQILPPRIHDKSHPMFSIFQSVYEKETGLDGTPVITSGGTYARKIENIAAFGPSFPGQKGIAHLPDEWMDLDDLITLKSIYKETIRQLSERKWT